MSDSKMTSTTPIQLQYPSWIKAVAGLSSGLVEAITLQPLDVIKTRLQLGVKTSAKYHGVWHCARTMIAEEGARSLYKGMTPSIAILGAKYSVRFGAFGWLQQALGGDIHGNASSVTNFAAGLGVGAAEAFVIVTPFEVVKTRLQKQTSQIKYRGMVHCISHIVKQEGIHHLWRGAMPTILRHGMNQAFNFMAFGWLNEHVWHTSKPKEVWKIAANGIIAGSLGSVMTCPMDVIKTRIMAQEYTPNSVSTMPKYRGIIGTCRVIVSEEGFSALYKGLTPRLIRIAPKHAITWTVYMRMQEYLERCYTSASVYS